MHEVDQQNLHIYGVWYKCTGIAKSFQTACFPPESRTRIQTLGKSESASVQNNDPPQTT